MTRSTPEARNGLWRSRWAAIGAAFAMVLGLGGVDLVAATPRGADPVVTTITPCRLVDTRPASQVGTRGTPLASFEDATFTVHGTNGNCTIPSDAIAILANVTAANGSAQGVMGVYPTGTTFGGTITVGYNATTNGRNQVTVELGGGQVNVLNFSSGTAHLIVDIYGYTNDHDHDADYVNTTGDTMTGVLSVPDLVLTTPKVHRIGIPESASVPRIWTDNPTRTLGTGGVFLTAPSGAEGLVAPVVLPEGARVTNVEARVFDSDSTSGADITLRLIQALGAGSYSFLATASSTGGTGVQTISIPVNHVISYSSGQSYELLATGATSSSLKIHNVIVTYEIDEI